MIIMKKANPYKYLILPTVLILSAIFIRQSNAEVIYCKNGKILNKKIVYRNRGVVWYEQSSGRVGVDIKNIEKIENDDGSVSKYDYNVIGQRIRDSVRDGKYADAIMLCTMLLETIPDDIQIRYLRGILSQKIGNVENARRDYDFLVENKRADAAILNNLGAIYGDDKKYSEAVELFIKAVAANPEMIEMRDNLAVTSLKANDYNRAMSEYEKIIERNPDNVNALYNLGVIYMSKGEYRKANKLWERALALNPEDADAKKALEAIKAGSK
ncbi:MAG: tetratricopeptide repeat protein [Candidatus Omnitrophota bacterium]|nr:tetratricopeptide repeat protein [Candidatus Omnitrophota bacterium]